MKTVLFGALLLALAACNGTQTSAQSSAAAQSPTAAQNPDQVVAEVDGKKITLKEVDERWRTQDPGEQARVTQLLYQNRRSVLDQMLGDMLIEEAAKASGVPMLQYIQTAISKRAPQVSDAEVQQFYEENKARAQGRTFEQLRDSIHEFLQGQRQQQARAQLVDELKKKKSGGIRVLLDPPRTVIELASDDPSLGPATAPVTVVEFSDYQ